MKTQLTMIACSLFATIPWGCSSGDDTAATDDASPTIPYVRHDLAATSQLHDLASDSAGSDFGGALTITINKPTAGSIVPQKFLISADIIAPAGVDEASVFAAVGTKTQMTRVAMVRSDKTNTFTANFSFASSPHQFVLPIVMVTAADKAGRAGEASEEVILDEVGPAVDLDPPHDFHMSQRAKGALFECSHSFDPVGPEAPSDGDTIAQLSSLRARIEDRGNNAPGQSASFFSLVDPTSVRLFVYQGGEPLVMHGGSDKVCDHINPALDPNLPAVNGIAQAVAVPLAPVSIAGGPDWSGFARAQNGSDDSCVNAGFRLGDPSIVDPPHRACAVSALTYFIPYTDTFDQSAIWTIPPVKPAPALLCLGLQFDVADRFQNGPLCVAVIATDNIGNRNVSRPIRVCLEKDGISTKDCEDFANGNMAKWPSCTDGCTPGVKDNFGVLTDAFSPGEIRGLPQQ